MDPSTVLQPEDVGSAAIPGFSAAFDREEYRQLHSTFLELRTKIQKKEMRSGHIRITHQDYTYLKDLKGPEYDEFRLGIKTDLEQGNEVAVRHKLCLLAEYLQKPKHLIAQCLFPEATRSQGIPEMIDLLAEEEGKEDQEGEVSRLDTVIKYQPPVRLRTRQQQKLAQEKLQKGSIIDIRSDSEGSDDDESVVSSDNSQGMGDSEASRGDSEASGDDPEASSNDTIQEQSHASVVDIAERVVDDSEASNDNSEESSNGTIQEQIRLVRRSKRPKLSEASLACEVCRRAWIKGDTMWTLVGGHPCNWGCRVIPRPLPHLENHIVCLECGKPSTVPAGGPEDSHYQLFTIRDYHFFRTVDDSEASGANSQMSSNDTIQEQSHASGVAIAERVRDDSEASDDNSEASSNDTIQEQSHASGVAIVERVLVSAASVPSSAPRNSCARQSKRAKHCQSGLSCGVCCSTWTEQDTMWTLVVGGHHKSWRERPRVLVHMKHHIVCLQCSKPPIPARAPLGSHYRMLTLLEYNLFTGYELP